MPVYIIVAVTSVAVTGVCGLARWALLLRFTRYVVDNKPELSAEVLKGIAEVSRAYRGPDPRVQLRDSSEKTEPGDS